jgi:hypothetical protein
MNYIKLKTLEYPRHEGDIRLEHPEITENQTGDTFPCPNTYAKVTWTDPPEFDKNTQAISEDNPVQIDGVWTMRWLIRNLTEQEISARDAAKAEHDAYMASLRARPNTDKPGSTPNAI